MVGTAFSIASRCVLVRVPAFVCLGGSQCHLVVEAFTCSAALSVGVGVDVAMGVSVAAHICLPYTYAVESPVPLRTLLTNASCMPVFDAPYGGGGGGKA